MPIIRLNLTPARQDLRWFAGLWWPAMCAAVGLMLFRKFHLPAAAILIWVGGGLLAGMGVIRPSIIQPWYIALMLLTYPIGWLVSHIILAAVYFGVVAPAGVLVRLFHDPMARRFERTQATYWTARKPAGSDRYFRQL